MTNATTNVTTNTTTASAQSTMASSSSTTAINQPIAHAKVILASRSPRRQELLNQIGVEFDLLDLDIDESVKLNEQPFDYVNRMAYQKAQAAWQSAQIVFINNYQYRAVITADTSVVLANKILGKPENSAHAKQMMMQLSGQTHQVITSVALSYLDANACDLVTKQAITIETSVTDVVFAKLSSQQVDDYIASKEGLDKAGGYAIQGIAAQFVESIKGSYSGVVGLPLYETNQLLNRFKSRDGSL